MMQQVSVEITMKQDPWLFDGVFEWHAEAEDRKAVQNDLSCLLACSLTVHKFSFKTWWDGELGPPSELEINLFSFRTAS
jgi:hypothetical protein